MDYWQGFMNWPLSKDWKCETCDTRSVLIWGLQHGTCRCDQCHTQYRMRDNENSVVDFPICQLKDEWKVAAKTGWEILQKPLTQFTQEEWEYYQAEVGE